MTRDPGIVDDVIARVGRLYGLRRADLFGGSRTQLVVRAKRAAHLVLRRVYGLSYPELGRALECDQQTSRASVKGGERLLERDPRYAEQVAALILATQYAALGRAGGPLLDEARLDTARPEDGSGRVLRLKAQ